MCISQFIISKVNINPIVVKVDAIVNILIDGLLVCDRIMCCEMIKTSSDPNS